MKTKLLSVVLVLIALTPILKAQISVAPAGNVSIGSNASAYTCFLWIKTNHPSGWGDASKISVTRTDTKALTVYYNGETRFYVLGDGTLYSNGIYLGSDRKLKENIQELDSPLDKILKLHGVSYLYKQNQDVMIDTSNHNKIDNNKSFSEKKRNKRIGVIAQEVETVIPEIVMTMPDSTKAVAYEDLIGYLIEAFKSQNATVNAQSLKIKELENRLVKLENKTSSDSKNNLKSAQVTNISTVTDNTTNVFLYQNIPNPFSEKTDIQYFLPENIKSASLYLFDMQGIMIKTIPISGQSQGSVIINGSELKPGMYIYTLIADGQEIDTKRMILTE